MGCTAGEDNVATGASQDMMLRSRGGEGGQGDLGRRIGMLVFHRRCPTRGRLALGPASSWARCFVSTAPASLTVLMKVCVTSGRAASVV